MCWLENLDPENWNSSGIFKSLETYTSRQVYEPLSVFIIIFFYYVFSPILGLKDREDFINIINSKKEKY